MERSFFSLATDRLRSDFAEEVDPVSKCGGVCVFHALGYVEVEELFLSSEAVAWCANKLADNDELFGVCEALRVVLGGLIDVLASANPHCLRVFLYRAEKVMVPLEVGEIRGSTLVDIFKEEPVAGYEASDD